VEAGNKGRKKFYITLRYVNPEGAREKESDRGSLDNAALSKREGLAKIKKGGVPYFIFAVPFFYLPTGGRRVLGAVLAKKKGKTRTASPVPPPAEVRTFSPLFSCPFLIRSGVQTARREDDNFMKNKRGLSSGLAGRSDCLQAKRFA